MTQKDKKAYDRYQAEIELYSKISKLLEKFSLKTEDKQPPMYVVDTSWMLDYMAR